jgi:hypothetical protein
MRDTCLIWIEELDPPRVSLSWSYFPWQNQTLIRRRVEKLVRKYARGWHCHYCGDLMPVWKRIDAIYCSESCRKMAAHKRRAIRVG